MGLAIFCNCTASTAQTAPLIGSFHVLVKLFLAWLFFPAEHLSEITKDELVELGLSFFSLIYCKNFLWKKKSARKCSFSMKLPLLLTLSNIIRNLRTECFSQHSFKNRVYLFQITMLPCPLAEVTCSKSDHITDGTVCCLKKTKNQYFAAGVNVWFFIS